MVGGAQVASADGNVEGFRYEGKSRISCTSLVPPWKRNPNVDTADHPDYPTDVTVIEATALREARRRIRPSAADIELCWTCGSCDAECPVNAATGRLRPQRIVRMAAFGLVDELLNAPEIWYCISCRRCSQICPNRVQPSRLIQYLQGQALREGRLSWNAYLRYRDWIQRFQHMRWNAVARCLAEAGVPPPQGEFSGTQESGRDRSRTVPIVPLPFAGLAETSSETGSAACYTCRECSSACPVVVGRRVFDPIVLFRMVNLGMADELAVNPSIWLCIQCRRCTDACPQNVHGHRILRRLQELSLQHLPSGADFPGCLERAHRNLYRQWMEEVERIVCR